MIETINGQHIAIANRMWEYDLSHETDLRFSSTRLAVDFCDDDVSSLLLESRLEEVFDPPPTTLSFVASSLFSISIDEDAMCYELANVSTQVPDCHETPQVSSCVDVVVMAPTSPDVIAYVSPDHIDMLPVSPLPSLPSPSLECPNLSAIDYHDALKEKVFDCIRSLGTFEGCKPSHDPFHD